MSEAELFKQAYDNALKLPKDAGTPSPNPNPKAEALKRAHELRKFEIENYWKRATYFWAFQVAAFGLFGLIWKGMADPEGAGRLAVLMPAALGAVSAQVGWLTAKGSKFWQENWEAHVDMLEEGHEGRLTQVIISSTGAQFSVSAANRNFMFLLMIGWIVVFVVVLCRPLQMFLQANALVFGLLSLLMSMALLAERSRTSLKGWRYQLGTDKWNAYVVPSVQVWFQRTVLNRLSLNFPRKPEIILRDTKAGDAEKPVSKS